MLLHFCVQVTRRRHNMTISISILVGLQFTVCDSFVVVVWCVLGVDITVTWSELRVLLDVGVDDIRFGRIERAGCR